MGAWSDPKSVASFVARKRVLLLLLALAAALRIVALVVNVKPGYLAGLLAHQTQMADAVLQHGQWFKEFDHGSLRPEYTELPGLALIDIAIWSITGTHSYFPIQVLQIVIDVAAVLAVYWITLRLIHRRRIALIAAGLYAVYPAAVVFAKTPALDTWAGFMLIGLVALFVWAREQPGRHIRLLSLGVLAGVGAYFRPTLILVPPALILVGYPGPWTRRLMAAAVTTLIAVMLIVPWAVRNTVEFHAFIPIRGGVGRTLWEGLGETSNNFRASDNDGATDRLLEHLRPDLVAAGNPVAIDNYLRDKALNAISAHPFHYGGLLLLRSVFLIPCLLALLWRRRWSRERLLLVAVAVVTILPYVILHMETRYWAIAGFVYLMLAAVVIDCAIERVGSRRSGISRTPASPA